MDTPTIAKYYREKDPMERLKLLEQSIAAGEEPVIPGQTVISVSG